MTTRLVHGLALVAALTTIACEQDPSGEATLGYSTEPGPTMRPGDNCLRCHNPSGQASSRPWTAAGTVFPTLDAARIEGVEGVRVELSDAAGDVVVALVTNEVGNFYTDEELPDPYFVTIEYEGERISMPCAPPAGSCNACHSPNPVGFAPGRIYLPGAEPDAGAFDCADWQAGGPGR